MHKRGTIVLAMFALTALALVLMTNNASWAGPQLLAVSSTHGVHLWDLPVLGAWMVGIACCWRLWRRRGN